MMQSYEMGLASSQQLAGANQIKPLSIYERLTSIDTRLRSLSDTLSGAANRIYGSEPAEPNVPQSVPPVAGHHTAIIQEISKDLDACEQQARRLTREL